ncbi:hypothetical protein SK128_008024 [Halocaridina rubra]|uniref:Uncharacterized protein n=1 Tax=Halocaridina rubra TaxID=373956 RepID=A0AAN9A8V5_HALRR
MNFTTTLAEVGDIGAGCFPGKGIWSRISQGNKSTCMIRKAGGFEDYMNDDLREAIP